MRNLFLTIAIITATIFQLAANNSPASTTLDVVQNEKSVVVNLLGFAAEANSLTITDRTEEVIFTDALDQYKNRVKYDLNQLPAGTYTFRITGDNYAEFLQIEIAGNVVKVVGVETHLKPSMTVKEDKVVVNAYFPNNEGIQVSIFSRTGELVYTYNETKVGNYEKSFNLEQLKSGNYEMVVSTEYFSQSSKISL